jgi:hypothetical protein
MANYYKDVIEYLYFDDDISYSDIVCKIAASHPKVVMDAVKELNLFWWKGEILKYRESEAPGGKVAAVKLWREKTGLALKEAKEAVESYWENN